MLRPIERATVQHTTATNKHIIMITLNSIWKCGFIKHCAYAIRDTVCGATLQNKGVEMWIKKKCPTRIEAEEYVSWTISLWLYVHLINAYKYEHGEVNASRQTASKYTRRGLWQCRGRWFDDSFRIEVRAYKFRALTLHVPYYATRALIITTDCELSQRKMGTFTWTEP